MKADGANGSSSMDEDQVKELLRPAKKHLKKLKSGTDNLSRDEKIAALKECVAGIGHRIDEVVAIKQAEGLSGPKWRKHCWVFASFFWPREGVNYSKLMDIHQKLVCHPESYHANKQVNESSPAPSKPKAKAKRKTDNDPEKPKKRARAAPKLKPKPTDEAKASPVKGDPDIKPDATVEERTESAAASAPADLKEEAKDVVPEVSAEANQAADFVKAEPKEEVNEAAAA